MRHPVIESPFLLSFQWCLQNLTISLVMVIFNFFFSFLNDSFLSNGSLAATVQLIFAMCKKHHQSKKKRKKSQSVKTVTWREEMVEIRYPIAENCEQHAGHKSNS